MTADNLARHTAIQTIRKSRIVQGQMYKARAFRNRQKQNRMPHPPSDRRGGHGRRPDVRGSASSGHSRRPRPPTPRLTITRNGAARHPNPREAGGSPMCGTRTKALLILACRCRRAHENRRPSVRHPAGPSSRTLSVTQSNEPEKRFSTHGSHLWQPPMTPMTFHGPKT